MSFLANQHLPIGPAIWSMILYASFQLAASPAVFSQHAEAMERSTDAIKVAVTGIIVNSIMVLISVIGLLAIVQTKAYASASIPVLTLVRSGPGASALTPIISILIILGAVSTAVNMISAGVTRFCHLMDKDFDPNAKPTKKVIICTFVLSLVCFCVAQFGLLTLISKGYALLAYLTFPVIVIPYILFTRLLRNVIRKHVCLKQKIKMSLWMEI